ncbi:unnamed protein product [Closterium sp. Naga37s-1]|nr:unnamed protein product [Closterium sp. Naga37s-1]
MKPDFASSVSLSQFASPATIHTWRRVVGMVAYGFDLLDFGRNLQHLHDSLGAWPIILKFYAIFNVTSQLQSPQFQRIVANQATLSFLASLLHVNSSCAPLPASSRPSLTWTRPSNACSYSPPRPKHFDRVEGTGLFVREERKMGDEEGEPRKAAEAQAGGEGREGTEGDALTNQEQPTHPWVCVPELPAVDWPRLRWRFDWSTFTILATSDRKPLAVRAWLYVIPLGFIPLHSTPLLHLQKPKTRTPSPVPFPLSPCLLFPFPLSPFPPSTLPPPTFPLPPSPLPPPTFPFPPSPLPPPTFPLPSSPLPPSPFPSSPLPPSPLPLFPSSPLPLFPSSPFPLPPSPLPLVPLPPPHSHGMAYVLFVQPNPSFPLRLLPSLPSSPQPSQHRVPHLTLSSSLPLLAASCQRYRARMHASLTCACTPCPFSPAPADLSPFIPRALSHHPNPPLPQLGANANGAITYGGKFDLCVQTTPFFLCCTC